MLRGSARRMAGGAMAVFLTLSPIFSTRVNAHSTLDSTSPVQNSTTSSPQFVTLTFNEEVTNSRVVLRNLTTKKSFDVKAIRSTQGEIVKVRPTNRLTAGKYSVNWRVRSSDGHYISGSFSFNVK